jgi:hypothetical protein
MPAETKSTTAKIQTNHNGIPPVALHAKESDLRRVSSQLVLIIYIKGYSPKVVYYIQKKRSLSPDDTLLSAGKIQNTPP